MDLIQGKSSVENWLCMFEKQKGQSSRSIITTEILRHLQDLHEGMRSSGASFEDPHSESHLYAIIINLQGNEHEELPLELTTEIERVWADPGVQAACKRLSISDLTHSLPYYMSNIKRIGDAEYKPTAEDTLRSRLEHIDSLRARIESNNIFESNPIRKEREIAFLNRRLGARSARIVSTYRMYVAERATCARMASIDCFGRPNAIIYTVDTCAYDEQLGGSNKMAYQLDLWMSVVCNRWLKKPAFILVFTKIDILEEHMIHRPVQEDGVNNLDDYLNTLQRQFVEIAQQASLEVRVLYLQTNLLDPDFRGPELLWKEQRDHVASSGALIS